MVQKPLSPINDFVFRKVFGENLSILEDFLKSVLDLPAGEYDRLTLQNPELGRDYPDDKLGILDILVHTTSGKVINVEVQVQTMHSMWERILFYAAKLVSDQLKTGKPYGTINSSICILIVDFEMVPENRDYHNRYALYNIKTGAEFPVGFEINILELPKATGPVLTGLDEWMVFFVAKTEGDFMRVVSNNPAIADAWSIIQNLSNDPAQRAIAESREKARRDQLSRESDAHFMGEEKGLVKGIEIGREKGIEIGREEGVEIGREEGVEIGREKERYDFARKLLLEKMPYDKIASLTGLTLAQVNALVSDQPDS